MKNWHGTISVKSNYKSNSYYVTVQASSLEEALEKAKKEFLSKRIKHVEILNINLTEQE